LCENAVETGERVHDRVLEKEKDDVGRDEYVEGNEHVGVPAVATLATILETCFGLVLVAEWQTRKAALGSSVLLTLFAMVMFSSDPKSPFDYSVFTAAFAALTPATHPARD
jgi:uncharacterized membrane protein YphA (DoxX/SURF4 family)